MPAVIHSTAVEAGSIRYPEHCGNIQYKKVCILSVGMHPEGPIVM